MNIYAKLTLLCVFLVIVTSTVLYYFANLQVQKIFRKELLTNLTHESEEAVFMMEQFISSRINDLKVAAVRPNFRMDTPQDVLNQELKNLALLNDSFYSFSLYTGNQIKVADGNGLNKGLQAQDYLGLLKKSHVTIDVSFADSRNEAVMNFATFLTNEPNGILVGHTRLDEFQKALGNLTVGNDTSRTLKLSLLNEEGITLYSNQDISESFKKPFQLFELIRESNALSNDQIRVLETDKNLFFVGRVKGYMNEDNDQQWSIVTSISKEAAFLPLAEIQNQLLLVISVVLVGAVVFALIAANLFVRPIVRLSKAAEHIEEGNLKQISQIKSNDEVGRLAKRLAAASQTLIERLQEQKSLNITLKEQKNEIAQQKVQLEAVNQQVSDSISYAQRIQRSILPETTTLDKVISGAFVVYEPKDIVSGDFYWFERVRIGRDEFLIIACADCTGHGVPGVIMSIMGSNQLTNIVYYQNYIDPIKILSRLDKVIKFELQRETSNSSRDGMELGLCVINLDSLHMEFSGVGIPLYLKRAETSDLEVYKSPRYMIGGIEGNEKEVSTRLRKETFQLKPGDTIYLASDGFQDQFGGPSDKKYMSKNFKKLLLEISQKPIQEQASVLKNTFYRWKGATPQTDDVVVIGITI